MSQLQTEQRIDRLNRMNADLNAENKYLRKCLDKERNLTDRLIDGIGKVFEYFDEHLPERLRPLLDKAKELLPIQRSGHNREQHKRGNDGMEL